MANYISRIGQKFGKLTPFRRIKASRVTYRCICDCGRLHTVLSSNLVSGSVSTCGRCFGDDLRVLNPATRSWLANKSGQKISDTEWRTYLARVDEDSDGIDKADINLLRVCQVGSACILFRLELKKDMPPEDDEMPLLYCEPEETK